MALLPGPGARVEPLPLNRRLRPPDERQEAETERFRRKRAAPWKTGVSEVTLWRFRLCLYSRHNRRPRAERRGPRPRVPSLSYRLQRRCGRASAEPAPSLRQPIGASPRANLSPPSRPEPLRSGFAYILQVFCV